MAKANGNRRRFVSVLLGSAAGLKAKPTSTGFNYATLSDAQCSALLSAEYYEAN
jgi:hypothetical protein